MLRLLILKIRYVLRYVHNQLNILELVGNDISNVDDIGDVPTVVPTISSTLVPTIKQSISASTSIQPTNYPTPSESGYDFETTPDFDTSW